METLLKAQLRERIDVHAYGQIHYRNVPETRAIRSFIEKHVARWAESRVEGDGPIPVVYHVSIKREGSGHDFVCHMRAQLLGATFTASTFGSGLHHTVIQCLSRMRRMPPPRIPVPNLAALLSAYAKA